MSKPNSIEIVVVLDRSGSMESIKKDMMGGFDTFMADQRKNGGDCRVTLAQFDNMYDVVYTALTIDRVPNLVLEPRGSTALFDALARTITETGIRLRAMRESDRPDRVLFVTITDGEENASQEYKGPVGAARIAQMVKHQREKYSWEFLYLGANQDAFKAAEAIGMQLNAIAYHGDGFGAQAMFSSASAGVTGYRGGEEKCKGGIINQAAYDSAYTNLTGASGTPQIKI